MSQLNNSATIGAGDSDIELAIMALLAEKQIHLTQALDVFNNVGQILKCIPQSEREAAISRLRDKSVNFQREGEFLSSMMIIHLLKAWEED